MKKYGILSRIPVTVIAIVVLLCGTVMAYMLRQTEYKDNQFITAEVSCEVAEDFDGQQKTSIQVKNTGNIDSYIRIRLLSYWVDDKGDTVSKPSAELQIEATSEWVKGSNDTYYYKSPVAPNALTSNLLSSAILLEKDDNGYLQVIEVFAEAIQSKPEDAVPESWGITLDSNGNITAAN